MCCFPGSMCEWSVPANSPASLWWRRCPPLARAGARTVGHRRGVDTARTNADGVLGPFKAYLNVRFTEAQGQVSGTRLFREIQARGYRGSSQVVRNHLAALRAGTAEPVRVDIPSPRKITSWIMRRREALTESQEERLLQVQLACPDITRACDLARAFADLTRQQRGNLLLGWIRQAEQDAPKPMKGFAGFLRQALDAVTAGLTHSSGPASSPSHEHHGTVGAPFKRLVPRNSAARRGSRRLISPWSSKSKSSPISTALPLSVTAPRKLRQAS